MTGVANQNQQGGVKRQGRGDGNEKREMNRGRGQPLGRWHQVRAGGLMELGHKIAYSLSSSLGGGEGRGGGAASSLWSGLLRLLRARKRLGQG